MADLDFSKIDVVDMLNALSIRNVHEIAGNEIRFSCPFPGHSHGDENPSACMNMASTAFICFGCHEKGNAVSFLANLYNISPMSAARFLRERYEAGWTEPAGGSIRREIEAKLNNLAGHVIRPPLPVLDESAFDVFESYDAWPVRAKEYWISRRGFSRETAEAWGVCWDPKRDRVTFPFRDNAARLIGFKGRNLTGNQPKYLVTGGEGYPFEPLEMSRAVFGIDRIAGTDVTEIIVVEGELNAMMLHQLGFDNAVALGMSEISDDHAMIIRQHALAVTVWFDSDKSGNDGAAKVIAKLEPHMPVRVVPEHVGDACDIRIASDVQELLDASITSVLLNLV